MRGGSGVKIESILSGVYQQPWFIQEGIKNCPGECNLLLLRIQKRKWCISKRFQVSALEEALMLNPLKQGYTSKALTQVLSSFLYILPLKQKGVFISHYRCHFSELNCPPPPPPPPPSFSNPGWLFHFYPDPGDAPYLWLITSYMAIR